MASCIYVHLIACAEKASNTKEQVSSCYSSVLSSETSERLVSEGCFLRTGYMLLENLARLFYSTLEPLVIQELKALVLAVAICEDQVQQLKS